jgi:hypothetical protein
MLIHWIFIYYYFLIRKSWMGEYQWVKFWFFIYQGLYKNHSFIIRRSWEGIHINETSIEFGSQSRSWINIYKKDTQKSTHKQIKKKQNKTYKTKTKQNNYTNCDFPGYSKCGKNILWLFFLWFCFYRRNTYVIYYIEHRHYININSIQSMIGKKSWT